MAKDKDDLKLHDLYTRLKQESNTVDIRPDDKNNQPSRRQLKKEGLKYFNETSLKKDYIRYNEPDTVNISNALLNDVFEQLRTRLEENYGFRGQFFPVGSFYDGTKVTTVNEFDCMFVCNGSRYRVDKQAEDGIVYKLYDRDTDEEVDAGDLRTALADAINDLAEDLDLPPGLVHGGFASPKFSGVRINKPAITLLFIWTPAKKKVTSWKPVPQKIPLSLDITLALSVPRSLEDDITNNVWDVIGPIRSQVSAPIDLRGKVHFIPVLDDGWNITSTLLESEILRHMPDVPIKTCIKLAKITVYQRFAKPDIWRPVYKNDKRSTGPDLCLSLYDNKIVSPGEIQNWQKQIERDLEQYNTSRTKKKSQRESVQLLLRHGHILLTPDVSGKYGEMMRPPMAVVSAAIKHLAIKTFCDKPAYHTVYDGVEFDMLVEVFRTLGDLQYQTVKHVLLPEYIKMVSIAPYEQHVADFLIRHVKFECRRLQRRLNGTKLVGSVKSYIAQKKAIVFLLVLFGLCLVLGG